MTKDPEEFLAEKGCAFSFANDSDDALTALAGGAGALPQTAVLNRRGEAIYNEVGPVTPEPLEALYEEASKRP